MNRSLLRKMEEDDNDDSRSNLSSNSNSHSNSIPNNNNNNNIDIHENNNNNNNNNNTDEGYYYLFQERLFDLHNRINASIRAHQKKHAVNLDYILACKKQQVHPQQQVTKTDKDSSNNVDGKQQEQEQNSKRQQQGIFCNDKDDDNENNDNNSKQNQKQKDEFVILKYSSHELQTNKQVVLAACQQYGLVLERVSTTFQNDYDIVLVACTQNGFALRYVSNRLRSNKQIVLAAVQSQPDALKYALNGLNQDPQCLIASGLWEEQKQNEKHLQEQYLQESSSSSSSTTTKVPTIDEKLSIQFQQQPFALFDTTTLSSSSSSSSFSPCLLVVDSEKGNDHCKEIDSNSNSSSPPSIFSYHNVGPRRKIVLSTRFSLVETSRSKATTFAVLLKQHEYIRGKRLLESTKDRNKNDYNMNNNNHNTPTATSSLTTTTTKTNTTSTLNSPPSFVVYSPNAFAKCTCDPQWTRFEWPCRGTTDTCQQIKVSSITGIPLKECCWRYSFRYQLELAKQSNGFMIQLVECGKSSNSGNSGSGHCSGTNDNINHNNNNNSNQQNHKNTNTTTTTTTASSSSLPSSSLIMNFKGRLQQTLGDGQKIEREMAKSVGVKVFVVYAPIVQYNHQGPLSSSLLSLEREVDFQQEHIDLVISHIQQWYEQQQQEKSTRNEDDVDVNDNIMSECIIRFS